MSRRRRRRKSSAYRKRGGVRDLLRQIDAGHGGVAHVEGADDVVVGVSVVMRVVRVRQRRPFGRGHEHRQHGRQRRGVVASLVGDVVVGAARDGVVGGRGRGVGLLAVGIQMRVGGVGQDWGRRGRELSGILVGEHLAAVVLGGVAVVGRGAVRACAATVHVGGRLGCPMVAFARLGRRLDGVRLLFWRGLWRFGSGAGSLF